MNRLETNQMKFINLRLGTFIHFNSATIQFQNSEIFVINFFCSSVQDLFPIPAVRSKMEKYKPASIPSLRNAFKNSATTSFL